MIGCATSWLALLAAGASVWLTSAECARAGDETWSATAGSGAWETGANWVSGSAPGASAGTDSGDVAYFKTGSAALTVLPDAGRNVKGLTFDTASAGAYTIGATNGNTLLLSSGGMILLTATAGKAQTNNAPLELQGDGGTYTFTNASTKALVIRGAVSGASTAGNTNTLWLAGGAGGTVSGAIGDGARAGSLALVKSGSGGWTLSGSNTFSGGLTLNAGTLSLGHNGALGTGRVTINGGTLSCSASRSISTGNAYTLNGNFAGSLVISSPLNLGTGPVLLGSNITVTMADNGYNAALVFGGTLSDGGNNRSLTVAGLGANPGSVQLEGTNTFTGGTTLNSGVLKIKTGFAIGPGSLTLNSGSIGAPTTGAGVTLTNNNAVIWGGNFSTISAAGVVDLGRGPVSLTGSRMVTMGNSGLIVGGPIANSGGVNYGITATVNDYGGSLTLNGTNTFDGGLVFKPNGTVQGYTASLNIGFLGADATASALGTGTLTLGPLGSHVNRNALQIDNTSGANGTLATRNAQKWDASFTFKGSRSLNMGTGPVTMGTNVTLTVTANTLTVGGPISGTNAWFSLTKAGVGTLALSGANTYGGGTVVTNGTLAVDAGGSLGSGNVRVCTNATLRLLTSAAVDDTATVELVTVGANTGKADLTNGVVEAVAGVIIGGTLYNAPGTYGSAASGATFVFPNQFSGAGVLRIGSEKGTLIRVL